MAYIKKTYPSIKCENCFREFIPKSNFQVACSKECGTVLAKKAYEENKRITDFQIFERDSFKCVYCGKSSIEHGAELTIDHVYPRSKGGDNDISNLVTCCTGCNLSKSNKIIDKKTIERIFNRNMQLVMNFTEPYADLQERLNKRWRLEQF